MDWTHWTRGHTIGHGSSATVSLARPSRSGEVFAVKSAELSISEFLQREQRILSRITCPRIVGYMGCAVSSENGKPMYNLFMEYVSGGTLSDQIRNRGDWLDEFVIRSHTNSILKGLDYLHSCGLVHCDIKGQNVLIGEDGAKIGDLGCARWVNDVVGSGKAIAGTPLFMAPEVARGEEQGCPADVWAMGCTIIEMATGSPPWPDAGDPVSALYRIGCTEEMPEVPSFLSEQAKDFLSKCLIRDPRRRWTVDQLLEHPFLDEPDSNSKRIRVSTSNSNSPNCVLDQGFWDSMEDSETTTTTTSRTTHYKPQSFLSNSAIERIQGLSKGVSSSPRLPSWTWNDNWVTVRSNSVEDAEEPATASGLVRDWFSYEEEMESLVVNEEMFNYSLNNVRTSNCSRRNSVIDCKFSDNINFERYKENLFVL